MRHLLERTSLLALMIAASPAFAQTAAPTAPAASQQNTGGLGDIVVTAQRKVENAQKAGIAIDVIAPKDLARAGVVTPTTLNAAVPALMVTQLGGPNTSYFIRGVGNFTGNAYSDPAVAFSLDGVYLGRPTSTRGTFYDIDRVEVLKGPQGTLYGRNATGGAINVLPTRPVLGQTGGYASAGYGNYNAWTLEGAVNAPIGKSTAIRISGIVDKHDGYNSDDTDDGNTYAVRAQILTKPSDALSIRLGADYSHNGGMGAGMNYTGSFNFAPRAPASANSPANYVYVPANLPRRIGLLDPAARAYFSTMVVGGAFINPGPIVAPHQDNAYWGVYADLNLKTSAGTLTVIPAYRDSKLDTNFNGPSFRGGLIDEHDKQYSLEARFAGTRIGPIDWLIGGFYYDEKIAAKYTFSQYFVQSYQDFNTGTKSTAAFGRITANVSDRFRLIGGLRYTHDKKRFDGSVDSVLELCANAPPPFGPGCFGGPSVPLAASLAQLRASTGLPLPYYAPTPFGTKGNLLMALPFQLHQGLSTNKATYRLAAEYDIAPRVLAYASYETGYRSGGFSTAPGYETFQPETLTASTIGIKSRFLDNRAQLNVELFHWKYKDQQISHFGIDNQGSTNFFTQNIGKATIQGADVDARFLVTPTTLLRGNLQYLDSNLDEFRYVAPGGPTNLPPVTGCAITPQNVTIIGGVPTPGSYAIDCSGLPEANSPKWSVNAGIEQTFYVGSAYKFVFNGDMRYRSDRINGFEDLPQQHSGSDTTFDAALSFGDRDDRWVITGYVRNIGNVDVPNITQFLGSNGDTVTTQYAPPRTFGLRGTVKF